MKLILVRHGQTEENTKGILQGQDPSLGTLNEKGLEQARLVGERFKDDHIDLIFSSDQTRAMKTAQEIAKHHDIEVLPREELREIDMGSFTGTTHRVNGAEHPGDVEQVDQIQERSTRLVAEVAEQYNDKTVVFVSHNTTIRCLTAALLNMPDEGIRTLKQSNTSVNIFLHEDSGHLRLYLYNCTKHLDG